MLCSRGLARAVGELAGEMLMTTGLLLVNSTLPPATVREPSGSMSNWSSCLPAGPVRTDAGSCMLGGPWLCCWLLLCCMAMLVGAIAIWRASTGPALQLLDGGAYAWWLPAGSIDGVSGPWHWDAVADLSCGACADALCCCRQAPAVLMPCAASCSCMGELDCSAGG